MTGNGLLGVELVYGRGSAVETRIQFDEGGNDRGREGVERESERERVSKRELKRESVRERERW